MKPAWALNKNLKLHSNVKVVLKKDSLSTLIQWNSLRVAVPSPRGKTGLPFFLGGGGGYGYT